MKNEFVAWLVSLICLGTLAIGAARAAEAPEFNSESSVSMASYMKERAGDLLYFGQHTCSLSKLAPGVFLTAHHCTQDMAQDNLTVVYGGEEVAVRYVVSPRVPEVADKSADLDVLITDGDLPAMKSLELGCNLTLLPGQHVVTGGFPGPMGFTYSEGVITSVVKPEIPYVYGADFWTDLHASGGASGSPVVDRSTGKQIGVLVEMWLQGQYVGAQSVGLRGLCPANSQ